MALIYIVEDDASIREVEAIALKNSNYEIGEFDRAGTFYEALDAQMPDLILLDIMLPDEDGYSIVRKLRSTPATAEVPIIMVTARTSEIDLLKGLDGGADDYMKKPFSVLELLSRIKALLRRSATGSAENTIAVGGIVMDPGRRTVTAKGAVLDLTYKEYELLHYLMVNQGIVLSRQSIMEAVWETSFAGETRTVDMHIKTLRHKLGPCAGMIRTIRGVGYCLDNNGESVPS